MWKGLRDKQKIRQRQELNSLESGTRKEETNSDTTRPGQEREKESRTEKARAGGASGLRKEKGGAETGPKAGEWPWGLITSARTQIPEFRDVGSSPN